jgi:pSer/pThr/pTyr-binding forkhead associated (FHA) protein
MATLCQIGEDGSITGRWELGSQPLVVGRDEAADARVEDEAVSRRHAVIQPEGDHYIIEDLGSQNGTWVDGRRLLTVRLHHKAQILMGRTQLVFLDQPPNKVVEVQAAQRLTGPRASVPPGAPPPSALNRSGVGLAKAA